MTAEEAGIRQGLRSVFLAGVAAADPQTVLAAHLPAKPTGRCIVVGAGKASAAMAAALEAAWPDVVMEGIVVTRYGHAVPTARIRIVEAAHPVPDSVGMQAAADILAAVQGLQADDLVLALISGGGSALLTLPAAGISLADKQAVNAALLRSGAPIGAMNTVRKALSRIKGGRLAEAAAPARVVTLIISDVPGDDPATIASGPTVPSATSAADALSILERYSIAVPPPVLRHLQLTAHHAPVKFATDIRMIASPSLALAAAARQATLLGWQPHILGDALEGESRDLAAEMAVVACATEPQGEPVLLLSGGETTVTLGGSGGGRGGRNLEFLLALALRLQGEKNIYAIAGDTDGIDGTEDAAGAIIAPGTLSRAAALQLDAQSTLAAHDSYTLFAALGDLLMTGPTLTNVNDLRAILIV